MCHFTALLQTGSNVPLVSIIHGSDQFNNHTLINTKEQTVSTKMEAQHLEIHLPNRKYILTKEHYKHRLHPLFSRFLSTVADVLSKGEITCGIDIPTDTTISMPSRTDKFGRMISLELTRKMSPIYK